MTLVKTLFEIEKEIKDYIDRVGGPYQAWYVGISSVPRDRLFKDHGVREKEDAWIYRTALDANTARVIEVYFLSILGTAGGSGGGDIYAKAVYAYRKNEHTKP
jgi:hypothetical protein